MLFPHLYRYPLGEYIALFHPLTFDVIFVPNSISEGEIEKTANKSGLGVHWSVSEDFSYNDYIEAFLKDTEYGKVDIKTLKMFTTTLCNLDCSYCLIEKNLETRRCKCKNISQKDAIEVIDKFSRLCMSQKPAKRTIMLYGGEPMINRDTVFGIIRHIRELEAEGRFNGAVEIDLESNGTLITDYDAELIREYNVFVLVSLDGTEEVHNTYRKTRDGKASYEAARHGYETLIKHGCMAVISSVFTDLYAENVDECIDEMTDVIRPKSIGLNIFHVLEDREIVNDRTLNNMDAYIHAFEKARDKGLYIEHIMRRIRPLTDKIIRVSDCGACGNRIVSDVDGNIGICEGLIGDPGYFRRRTDYNEVKTDSEFMRWSVRTPLNIEGCIGCKAMGICGGGCVSNALRQNGDIYTPDNYICESSKAFVDWALENWWKVVEPNMQAGTEAVHVLTDEERGTILGTLGRQFDIPLQTVSKQFEREIK